MADTSAGDDGRDDAVAARPSTRAVNIPLSITAPAHPRLSERRDAARNREKILITATALIEERGAADVSMEEVAEAAGVGKGTLFRRFGSRSGLLWAVIDLAEVDLQHAFMFGPPPLGPGASPRDRLVAYGHARTALVVKHCAIFASIDSGGSSITAPPHLVAITHIRQQLTAANVAGDVQWWAEMMALLGFSGQWIQHQIRDDGYTLERLQRNWTDLVDRVLAQSDLAQSDLTQSDLTQTDLTQSGLD